MRIALLPRRSFHGKLVGLSLYQFLLFDCMQVWGTCKCIRKKAHSTWGIAVLCSWFGNVWSCCQYEVHRYVIGRDAELIT